MNPVLFACVTRNRLPMLSHTLPSVLEYIDRQFCDLYMIDNGSNDGTVAYLYWMLHGKKNCHLIVNPQNIGYGPALSQAMALRAEGQHLCTSADDVLLLQNGIVETLAQMVETDWHIGWVSPYGFNLTGWIGFPREVGPYQFNLTGIIRGHMALMPSWVCETFGAFYQPALYGEMDYIASKRIERMGLDVGYWVPPTPVWKDISPGEEPERTIWKDNERRKAWRAESERVGDSTATIMNIWEVGGPGGELYYPLPPRATVPIIF